MFFKSIKDETHLQGPEALEPEGVGLGGRGHEGHAHELGEVEAEVVRARAGAAWYGRPGARHLHLARQPEVVVGAVALAAIWKWREREEARVSFCFCDCGGEVLGVIKAGRITVGTVVRIPYYVS